MRQVNFRILAVFLVSIVLIAFEIAVMRVFSVGSWSNFGSMVISIALLGFGAAGTILTFFRERVARRAQSWLQTSCMLLSPSMAGAHIASQHIPFNPLFIVSDPMQIAWISLFFIVYSLPFFIGALFIGVSFMCLGSRIHHLYFWNMCGSGLGGFAILGCMYIFPPDTLCIPIFVIAFVAGLFSVVRVDPVSLEKHVFPKHLFATCFTSIISIAAVLLAGDIHVSDFKSVSYVRTYPDSKLEYYSHGPSGVVHVYSSSYFHFAPGLSDNATMSLKKFPEKAFMGLFIDGNGPIGIMRKLDTAEEGYIDYLPMSAPYAVMQHPDVLLVKLGGGASLFTALYHGAAKVDIAEPNPLFFTLLRDIPVIAAYNQHVLDDSRIRTAVMQPRAFCRTSGNLYDLVEISLTDSIGLSQDGGAPVEENYTYTKEAFADYRKALKPDGILSVTVWNKLDPPRNVPKLLATAVQSLQEGGVQEPGKHIFVFQLLYSTATVLIKNSPFTEQETEKLKAFCEAMSFEICYYPGIPPREKNFADILASYEKLFSGNGNLGSETGMPDLLPGDFYHFALRYLLEGRGKELEAAYVFDISPMTDDRPYYSAYLKPQRLGMYVDQLASIADEWGYLMLLATLVLSVLFGLFIILIPGIGSGRALRGKGTWRVILYFACLGLGYMMIELYLIQKLVFFLAEPIFSLSIVITSLLVISGLGSLFSKRFLENRTLIVRIAGAGIIASVAFYLFGLQPLLSLFLDIGFPLKVLLSVACIAPAAFFLGIPFPTGLSAVTEKRPPLLPWAWGVNGALSVAGSVLPRVVSVSFGFGTVLIAAALLYVIAVFAYEANEG